ncbi:MerR family transcriptional regulator [Enterococcus sp. AZ103]|uniref:MerR family transcriptional regulator n=1 Tax=Enterococcus sp. AZ103 TaxID=2774628 RepID=UPI003F2113D0
MFKIGEFSRLTNMTVRALHHYEKIDLLVPNKIDEVTNYRYYSTDQLEIVNRIKILQSIDLPLKSIREVLYSDNPNLLNKYYELRKFEIEEEINSLKIKQKLVEDYSKRQKEGINMAKYNVEIKMVPTRKVMSLRKVIPTFDDESKLWEMLYAEFQKQNVKMTNPPKGMSLYHDKEYKDSDIDVEVQSEIIGNYQDTKDVKFFDTSEFTMASVIFNGSYDQMPEVNQAIGLWIKANGYELSGPMINIPHVSPAQEQNPEKWVTEAGYVVKKIEE